MTASTPDPQGAARRDPAAPGAEGGQASTARRDRVVPAAQSGSGGPARQDPAALPAEPSWDGPAGWDPGPPSEAVMAEQEAILAEEIATRVFESPEDEFSRWLADPDTGPPDGADAGLGELASPVRDAILDARAAAAGPEPEGPFPAGVIAHDQVGPGGPGFASGSVLDRLEAGPVLAATADDAWQAGLGGLADDELAGLMLAWQRCESRAAAGLLAGTAELAKRRAAHGDWRVLEHLDTELALLFTLTRRSAGPLLDFAQSLARLPATQAALAAGRIDRARADVIAYETAMLDDDQLAAAVELLVIEDAPRLTTSKLRDRVRRAVLAADPAAARRRADKARRDARVELWDERSGSTAALAGRDLPVAAALAADQRIDHAARELKTSGIAATLAQLRAAVFLGLLTGHDPVSFLPPPEDREQHAGDDERRGDGEQRAGDDETPPAGQDSLPATPGNSDADRGQLSEPPVDPAGEDTAPGQHGDPQAAPAGHDATAPDAGATATWIPAGRDCADR